MPHGSQRGNRVAQSSKLALLEALVKAQTVNLVRLANAMDTAADKESNMRRLQRFIITPLSPEATPLPRQFASSPPLADVPCSAVRSTLAHPFLWTLRRRMMSRQWRHLQCFEFL